MIGLYFIICMLNIIYTEDVTEGFCELKGESCNIQDVEGKYLFYVVNPPEGFNLRRDVYMRFAIMFHDAKKSRKKFNWRLVLPPWHRLYHWKTIPKSSKPTPWSAFFDVESLKSFAPVIEYNELLTKLSTETVILDRIYVLKNYDNAFEDGVFTEKWETEKHCNFNRHDLGYEYVSAKEIVCVKFQGKISKLWEIISLHPDDKKVMFVHGEIPLHDEYGTKTYWECRKSMKFNSKLLNKAAEYIKGHFDCKEKYNTYVSVHWRRQDFARARKNDVPSIKGTAKQIKHLINKNKLNITKVFIASDAEQSELKDLENELNIFSLKAYFYKPTKNEIDKIQDGGIAIIEQIICSRAAYFIGTHESTYTFRIQEEREILSFDSDTTFNRLCPDKGRCEKPSRWTIIQ